jgi:hypothetical protein
MRLAKLPDQAIHNLLQHQTLEEADVFSARFVIDLSPWMEYSL